MKAIPSSFQTVTDEKGCIVPNKELKATRHFPLLFSADTLKIAIETSGSQFIVLSTLFLLALFIFLSPNGCHGRPKVENCGKTMSMEIALI